MGILLVDMLSPSKPAFKHQSHALSMQPRVPHYLSPGITLVILIKMNLPHWTQALFCLLLSRRNTPIQFVTKNFDKKQIYKASCLFDYEYLLWRFAVMYGIHVYIWSLRLELCFCNCFSCLHNCEGRPCIKSFAIMILQTVLLPSIHLPRYSTEPVIVGSWVRIPFKPKLIFRLSFRSSLSYIRKCEGLPCIEYCRLVY